MRRISLILLTSMFFLATPAIAGTGGEKNAPPAEHGNTAAPAAPAKPASVQPVKPGKTLAPTDIQKLQDLIEAQQQELARERKALEEQQKEINALKTQSPGQASAPAAKLEPEAQPAAAPARKPTESSSADAAARLPAAVLSSEGSTSSPAAGKTGGADPPEMQAKEPKLGPLAFDKIKLGITFFGDYAFYGSTGFGPQFITQINQPGPGNDHFNSFDVTRAYLNFFYTPNDKVTLRITPNIYRQVDGNAGSIGNGNGASMGGSTNGNLVFRLKYAYVEFNKLFASSAMFGKDKITLGSETNPLIDWEEGLYGYRYTSLVPWNYLSLSSTFVGAKIHGPIEWNGREYLDYDVGVFNTATFHAIEQNDKKDVMARLTFYPTGTTSDRTGFGVTFFENYGYNTKTPDTYSTPLNRIATIVFYQTHSKSAQIAFEYDLGRNAFGTGNLFSGAGPASGGIYDAGGATKDIGTVASAVLAGNKTRQQGVDFFGHIKLGHSPFALFGLFQYFEPNTNFNYTAAGFTNDPIDFDRTVAGLSYHYNKHLDFALEDSNFHWLHPQGVTGTGDTNGLFLNFQFNY